MAGCYHRHMKFEHLITINDPADPLLEPLTRAQLWHGLLQRVDNPLLFLPGLQSFTLLERSEVHARRELDFGAARIVDSVRLEAGQQVEFVVETGAGHAGGSLCIRIEEPAPEVLFLRFTYHTNLEESGGEDAAYVDYVKSAYLDSDIECVRTIRELLATGQLH
ncbi:SRPBCC family protein [Azonexus hydrophilus]